MYVAPVPPAPLILAPKAITFDDTLGALLIGEIIAAVLFGVTSVQIYVYYGRSHHDGRIMKWAVAVLWILDAAHMAFTSHSVYHYMVTNFMNPRALTYCPWSFAANMVIGNFSQVIVTGMFAFRIWKLSGKVWLLLFMIPPTLCNSTGSIAIAILVRRFPLYEDFKARYSWLWCATFTAWTFCDCVIAVSLCTILARQRTGFRRTDSLIRTIIMYIVSTGALTSSVAIASAITYAIMPRNFIFIALSTTLPKLHINSVLALLNSREAMRERISEPISIHVSNLVGDSLHVFEENSLHVSKEDSLHVTKENDGQDDAHSCERTGGREDRNWGGEVGKVSSVAYGHAY